jgi:hypothetical protein
MMRVSPALDALCAVWASTYTFTPVTPVLLFTLRLVAVAMLAISKNAKRKIDVFIRLFFKMECVVIFVKL